MPSEEIQYFLAKQRVLSTHPDFNRDTRLLPQCQGWGLFSNGSITDMAEMLLRVGVLKLMQDYPTRDDLSLEQLLQTLPEDYKFLNNCQKPQVTMVDPVSYYLQGHRYPGEFKTSAEVSKALNAIMYLGGEYLKKKPNMRILNKLFTDSMKVNDEVN